MKKYAIAVCNLISSKNEVKIVDANNKIEAIIIGVEGQHLEDIIDYTLEELQQYYFDGDLAISEPIEIK